LQENKKERVLMSSMQGRETMRKDARGYGSIDYGVMKRPEAVVGHRSPAEA